MLLEQRLAARYGSLDMVQNTPEARELLKATARDFFEMVHAETQSVQVQCRVEASDNIIRITSHAFELTKPTVRRLATKKCKVVDLTAWRLARGR